MLAFEFSNVFRTFKVYVHVVVNIDHCILLLLVPLSLSGSFGFDTINQKGTKTLVSNYSQMIDYKNTIRHKLMKGLWCYQGTQEFCGLAFTIGTNYKLLTFKK